MFDPPPPDPAETYTLLAGGDVKRGSDGATIPPDPSNQERRQYQAWLAAGGTPAPAVAPVVVATRYQIVLVINDAGKAAAFETAIANLKPPYRQRWLALYRPIPASNPVFVAVCSALGLDPVATIAAAATRN